VKISIKPCQLTACFRASPVSSQCVEETFCTVSLKEYHSLLVHMPNRINERSLAAWKYVENIDLNRVPQVIHEAQCLDVHSCKGIESASSLESIPISLKMPVLRKNARCLSYSLEFEAINIACVLFKYSGRAMTDL
uniref:Uncharacterized protein n=1 Tax=Denticeps clupeoides TaxID=299321 RepID=A0AAY4BF25_9TELE